MHIHQYKCFSKVCHAKEAGLMRGFEQDQPPFYDSSESESEIFTGDLWQMQIQNIRVRVDKSYRFTCSQRPGGVKDIEDI